MNWESSCTRDSSAPASQVWAAIVDGRRWAEWSDRFEWMYLEGPLEPGVVATIKLRRTRQTAFVVEAVEPQRRLVLGAAFGPLAYVRVVFDVEPRERGSSIRYGVSVEGLLSGLAVRLLGARLADGAPATLERLAQYASGAEKEEAR